MWGRHILIGASCFTNICCRLYTVVSDRVCSSTDRIRKLCYIRSYSIEINLVKTIIAIVSGTYVYGSFWLSFQAAQRMIELRVTHRHHAENDTLNIRQEAYYNVIAYLLHSISQRFGNMVVHLYMEP